MVFTARIGIAAQFLFSNNCVVYEARPPWRESYPANRPPSTPVPPYVDRPWDTPALKRDAGISFRRCLSVCGRCEQTRKVVSALSSSAKTRDHCATSSLTRTRLISCLSEATFTVTTSQQSCRRSVARWRPSPPTMSSTASTIPRVACGGYEAMQGCGAIRTARLSSAAIGST